MTDSRNFRGRRESVAQARRFVRETLRGQSAETLEAVELMVSELATNCVQHARSDFEVAIEISPAQIRIETRDRGGGQPTLRSPTHREPTGRGLRVVEALSDAWGITPSAHGKTVWFTLTSQRRSADVSPCLGLGAA